MVGANDTASLMKVKVPLNGHFGKGQWHCNCQPRKPAIQFKVNKESPNKGRYFYTCQVDRTKGKTGEPANCGFFLWAEEAMEREKDVLLANARSEPTSPKTPSIKRQQLITTAMTSSQPAGSRAGGKTPITPMSQLPRGGADAGLDISSPSTRTASQAKSSGTLAASTQAGRSFSSNGEEDELAQPGIGGMGASAAAGQARPRSSSLGVKRKHAELAPPTGTREADNDFEDYDFGELSSDEERQMVAITDSTSSKGSTSRLNNHPPASSQAKKGKGPAQSQQQQQQQASTAYPTPSTTDSGRARKKNAVEGNSERDLTGKPTRRVLFEDQIQSRQENKDSGATTATTKSFTSSPQITTTPSSSPAGQDAGPTITDKVMDLLKGQRVDAGVMDAVREELEIHAKRAKGFEHGRSAARSALARAQVEADRKIMDLQERVKKLEDGRMRDRELRKVTKAGIYDLWKMKNLTKEDIYSLWARS